MPTNETPAKPETVRQHDGKNITFNVYWFTAVGAFLASCFIVMDYSSSNIIDAQLQIIVDERSKRDFAVKKLADANKEIKEDNKVILELQKKVYVRESEINGLLQAAEYVVNRKGLNKLRLAADGLELDQQHENLRLSGYNSERPGDGYIHVGYIPMIDAGTKTMRYELYSMWQTNGQ